MYEKFTQYSPKPLFLPLMRTLYPIVLLLVLSIGVVFNTEGQSTSTRKVTPLKGEGLSAFLNRHNLTTPEQVQWFMTQNARLLGTAATLYADRTYEVPEAPAAFYEPLFGPQFAHFNAESEKFKGACFYLVSGHGGPDPGAIGTYENHQLCEDEYAYDIMLRLARNLMVHGAKVHIVIQDPDDGIRNDKFLNYDNHETCMGDPIPLDQLQRLKQRSEKINELHKTDTEPYRRAISIHLDSRNQGKQVDVYFYHYPGSKKGEQLSTCLRNTFEQKYKQHQPFRGFSGTVSNRDLYVLRSTHPAAVFIELGNIQNWRDQQRFIIDNNRQAVANWLADGLFEDFLKETNQ